MPRFPKFNQTLPDVTGKVFVITGTTSGTGYVAARTVAEHGGQAVLLNRASERATKSLAKLQEEVPHGQFVPVECDLQSFDSVRNAAKVVKSKYADQGGIYCLANNAGIMATPDRATVDGYDTQMQTNHLSHFLLTAELLPLLERGSQRHGGGDARIVNHSSLGRLHTPQNCLEEKYFGKNGGNLGGDEVKMMGGACFERYFQSKLANSVFTYGLDQKLKKRGKPTSNVRAICAHPGGSNTNLGDHLQFGMLMNCLMRVLMPLMAQTPEDGAMGLLRGMMDPAAESGVLYGPKNSGMAGAAVPNPPKPFENDPAAIDMLWRTSEAATGVKLL